MTFDPKPMMQYLIMYIPWCHPELRGILHLNECVYVLVLTNKAAALSNRIRRLAFASQLKNVIFKKNGEQW